MVPKDDFNKFAKGVQPELTSQKCGHCTGRSPQVQLLMVLCHCAHNVQFSIYSCDPLFYKPLTSHCSQIGSCMNRLASTASPSTILPWRKTRFLCMASNASI